VASVGVDGAGGMNGSEHAESSPARSAMPVTNTVHSSTGELKRQSRPQTHCRE